MPQAAFAVAAIVAVVVSGGASSGCAKRATLPPVPLDPPPATFAERSVSTDVAVAPVSDAWWEDFDAPPLSEVVRAALEHNHDLLAAAARVEQAEALARIAGADRKPSVSAGLDGARRRQNFIGLPIPGSRGGVLSTTSTNLGVSIDVRWEADLWGRLKAAQRAAVADAQAIAADFAAARLSIAGQTAKAWSSVAEAAAQVDLVRGTVESWERSRRQVRDRYERGLRSPLDVRQANRSVADAEALLALQERQLDRAERQLEILTGNYPARALPVTRGVPDPPRAVPAGLPADLVARRPDLVAAERRLLASSERVLVARRALYPSLALTGSGGTASNELEDLLDGDFRVWSLVAGLARPLFQGGRLRADVDRTRAASEEAVATYARDVLRAYGEVEAALAAERYLATRADRLAEAVHEAGAALDLAGDRYARGLEAYVTVLDAQRALFSAERAALAVRRERFDNRIDLYLALGGGFETPYADVAQRTP